MDITRLNEEAEVVDKAELAEFETILSPLVGARFGAWTVLNEAPSRAYGKSISVARYMNCRCDCGNEREVMLKHLRRGESKRCVDCAKPPSPVGKSYGNWTVLEIVGTNSVGARLARCRCKCGYERVQPVSTVVKGRSRSCNNCRPRTIRMEDLVGKKFGFLEVLEELPRKESGGKFRRRVLCRCDCGKKREVWLHHLVKGNSQSCGCERVLPPRRVSSGERLNKHPLYGTWCNMRKRCNNPNEDRYHVYGGRGIRVHPAWDRRGGFQLFRDYIEATLGPRPSKQHTLDRINNNGDYEPGNLRWATVTEQNRNTTRQTNPKVLAWLRENYPEAYGQALAAVG